MSTRKIKIVSQIITLFCVLFLILTLYQNKVHGESLSQEPYVYAVSNTGEIFDFKAIVPTLPGFDPNFRQVPEYTPKEMEMADFAQIIIGSDDRVQVSDTTSSPWVKVVQIYAEWSPGVNFICSGWMLGPSTVATAGHCIYGYGNSWVFASNVRVTPGYNTDASPTAPFSNCYAIRAWILSPWQNSGDTRADYGVYFLNCRIGELTGNFGYRVMTDADLAGLSVGTAGYPYDKGGSTQWYSSGTILESNPNFLYYDNDSYYSQSGSGIWEQINDSCGVCVVAIHSGGDDNTGVRNVGVRITNEVFDFLYGLNQKRYQELYLPFVRQ